MGFPDLLRAFTEAVVRNDARAAAACFTPDGVYHDVFYGAFRGRAAIVEMIEERFHRDGRDFRWTIVDPISDGRIAYARYVFSSRAKAPDAPRAVFEGIVHARLSDGLFEDYDEVAEAATGLSLSGTQTARLAKFVARRADRLRGADIAAGHFD